MRPTVYVVDDDGAMREALRLLLQNAGLAVQVFADGPSFLEACSEDCAGCVLLDVSMPGMSGQEVHAALIDRGVPLPVVFLTAHGDIPMAVRAVQSGAVDFLEKPIRGPQLLERLHRALALDEERREAVRQLQEIEERYARLSPREREVMALVTSGLSNKQIARKLDLSPRTVETHRAHAMHKMGVSNTAELIAVALHCID